MDGVERVMVLGIFIVIVLILGVLAWDASSEDPTAVLAPGADGGSGASSAALSDNSSEGRASNPRGEMAPGPSLSERLLERRRKDNRAGSDELRAGVGRPAERPGAKQADERVAHASTKEPASQSAPRSEVPSLSSSTRVPTSKPALRTHTVQEGDTAWRIASKHYGPGDMNAILDMIQDANPGLDLEQLGLGQVITLPAKAPANAVLPAPQERAAAGEGRLYKVVSGDTLHGIAQEQFNDSGRWKEIYDLNRHLIASPSDLSVGVTLVLPEK
ncbi:MAG: hypothetical protein DHS20C15_18850 [Planctomycetota bacterium]|nr:MAG: hypothetical protein DHS20C15_18850 [Planctomycetota bacterium]